MITKLLFKIALAVYINVLCFRNIKPDCTKISRQYNISKGSVISHDALQRLLQMETKWNEILREKYVHLLNKKGGKIIIDDTVLAKPFSKELGLLAWLWSSSDQKFLYGIGLVLVIWTDGKTRFPLGFRFWKKGDKKTKIDLAMEILFDAKYFWKIKPDYVLMDSFYPAAKLLKRIRKYGWHWLAKIKPNRLIDGYQVQDMFNTFYGSYVGKLSENIRALVVKEDEEYWATSDIKLTSHQVKVIYQDRQMVEEVIKILKSELRIEGCSARSEIAQTNHVWLTLLAFCQLEHYRLFYKLKTIYQLREMLFNIPIPTKLRWNQEIINIA
jgi:hypothetical protein